MYFVARSVFYVLMRLVVLLLVAVFFLSGCATRKLPPYEKPLRRSQFQRIQTTAYTHSEKDHWKYGRKNAMGTNLVSGTVSSAAADWSRWPAGTIFQLVDTKEIFRVDDYGWALAGRNVIDLYKPNRAAMNQWGRRVMTIEILKWGDDHASYRILHPRKKHRHVKRMLRDLERRL